MVDVLGYSLWQIITLYSFAFSLLYHLLHVVSYASELILSLVSYRNTAVGLIIIVRC